MRATPFGSAGARLSASQLAPGMHAQFGKDSRQAQPNLIEWVFIEWFNNKSQRALFHEGITGLLERYRSNDENRGLRVLVPNGPERAQTVHPVRRRHHHIERHKLGMQVLIHTNRLGAVLRFTGYFASVLLQVVAYDLSGKRRIIYY